MGNTTGKPVFVWTDEMDQLMLFMRYINMAFSDISDVMTREFGVPFTRPACISRTSRLLAKRIFYRHNPEDFV